MVMALSHTSALDVARYLILLASSEEEPEPMTPLRLQKLLYYAEGWSLIERNESLFRERIEAWTNGPVVREVWQLFQGYTPISPDEGSDENLTDDERAFIRGVWKAYKEHSGVSLTNMTHDEAPWKDAREGLSGSVATNREITRDSMRRYFETI